MIMSSHLAKEIEYCYPLVEPAAHLMRGMCSDSLVRSAFYSGASCRMAWYRALIEPRDARLT